MWSRTIALTVLLIILILVAVYPLGTLLVRSFQTSQPWEPIQWGLANWSTAFGHPLLPQAFLNTAILATARVAIAGAMGILFAWLVTRTNMPWKRTIEVLLLLGFFIPPLPMVFGWLLLLDGHSGLINELANSWFGLESGLIDIRSHWGIVWAHLASSTSVMFILAAPAFRNLDSAMEEAGMMSGMSPWRTFRRVTVPALAPAILVALILVFVKSLESFELELMLGVPDNIYVYSTLVWLFIRLDPPLYGAATAISIVFLAALVVLIIAQWLLTRGKDYVTISGHSYRRGRIDLGRWRWAGTIFAFGFIGTFIVLPLSFLALGTFMRVFGFFDISNAWTFSHWVSALTDQEFIRSFINTIIMGLSAAVIGAPIYAFLAYMMLRTKFRGRAVVDFLIWLPWAIPGVLIGLALLWIFLGSGPVLAVFHGSLSILVVAIVIKEMPLGVQTLKTSVLQIHPSLEEAAQVSGATWIATFRSVVLPLLKPSMIMVGLISFIVASREIPAVIFLASPQNSPLAPKMLFLMEEGRLEEAAIIGLILTIMILLVALPVLALRGRAN